MSIKEQLHAIIDSEPLPEDTTPQDALYRLYVAQLVKNRLVNTREEDYLTDEQARERLKRWLTD